MKKLTTKILFLCLSSTLFISSVGNAQAIEKWTKFTCRGPITPIGKTPIVYKDIMVAHFRVGSAGYLSATALYDQNYLKMQTITDLCSERRWQQMDLTGWTGNGTHTTFLDWETDHLGYERYLISSVEFNPTSLRTLGMPCDKSLTCTSIRGSPAACNLTTNTCEAP